MIPRGTTPTHWFTIPFNASVVEKVKVIFAQEDKKVFEKLNDACIISGNTVETTLTEEETLMLNQEYRTQIQLRVKLTDGTLHRSNIIVVDTGELLENDPFEVDDDEVFG